MNPEQEKPIELCTDDGPSLCSLEDDLLIIDEEIHEGGKRPKWYRRICATLLEFLLLLLFHQWITTMERRSLKRREFAKKLKVAKPTLHEGFLFDHISWTVRDKPLSNKEVEDLMNS